MKNFKVDETPKTPSIEGSTENGEVIIKGRCLPEDARIFFGPFFDWMDDFIYQTPGNINVRFDLVYFNTSASKMILDIIKRIASVREQKDVSATWVYEEDDMEMMEVGLDYQNLVGDLLKLEAKSFEA